MITETLRKIQEREHLTDAQMGAKLGIHEKSWSRLKHGHSTPHDWDFLTHAVRVSPEEMAPIILQELLGPDYRKIVTGIVAEMLAEAHS